ncbi:MarR family winged helix-turn-helix transcriptional regulator [Streptomyces sp. NBC_00401]|uniref:MarR family winged helix-turn-helix transcriptional regulator n=1 Tax=Streptomyces sp. NBC_00401 TaxID=2975738 RepID=UPI00225AA946|nr:MarR family transcriptional regulator [Streptomyces sp. NBC_00401]MCX5084433.1 MarR family transcriptional regulator [Streptomyces sp. NBC_00401]
MTSPFDSAAFDSAAYDSDAVDSDPFDSEQSAELAERLRAAIQQLLPELRAQGMQNQLTPSRLAALAALSAHGPLRISDLATRMGIALSTVSRMVDLLDGFGWIEREADPKDQRATLIALNETGQALLDSTRRQAATRLAERIDQLTADHRHTLHDALPALEALSTQSPAEPPPGEPPGTGRRQGLPTRRRRPAGGPDRAGWR